MYGRIRSKIVLRNVKKTVNAKQHREIATNMFYLKKEKKDEKFSEKACDLMRKKKDWTTYL